jgi:diguanylate cyclase (GGDEF)-like protein/PAS domain S-box-containing protein
MATGAAVVVILVTTVIIVARPGLSGADLAVLLAYAGAAAVMAALLTANRARHRWALHTTLVRSMAEALEREERLHLIVASLHEGLIFQDRDLRVVEFNDAAAQILGLTDAAIGRRPDELGPWQPLHEDGTVMAFEDHPAARTLRTGQPNVNVVVGVATATATLWAKANTVPVFDEDGAVEGVITTFHDITAERSTRSALESSEAAVSEATEALTWQAFHDPLTGLPNRAQLVERLTAALAGARVSEALTAVLIVDLDRFKNVNDAMGHDAGDQLLVEVADRLLAGVRSGDVVARLGADEFMVLAEALADHEEATEMADRLRAAVSMPIALPRGTVTLSASVGIAFDVDHRPSTLLRDADMALHKAKEHGRDRVEVFDESLRAETIRKVAAEQMLRQALDEDGLRVLYQPIVDLTSGAVIGAEALLRVLGPSGELLTPASFIGIAEETGLIVPIGAGVLDDACRQLALWREDLGDRAPRTVSVNVSARQIATRAFSDVVARTLERHALDPESLTLELTETTLIEAGHAAYDAVEALHELGVSLAIDDFGTGYSSLAYLKRFPVDIVKIDRSFVAGLGQQQHDTEIVRAVLALGQSLGLVTVAEGIETPEQRAMLRELGCDRGQGFLLARPVPSLEVVPTIERIGAHALPPPPGPVLRLADWPASSGGRR